MIKTINGISILDYADIKNHDSFNVDNLTEHTLNTWQADRSEKEKAADTRLGKFAEDAVMSALEADGFRNYHSYDSFRNDGYKKHAPFDGIICSDLNPTIVDFINRSVADEGNKLTAKTRDYLREHGISTVEIKSTRLAQKYKDRANFKTYNNEQDIEKLIEYLSSLDYLTYPFYTRYGDMDFDKYCWFVETRYLHSGYRGQQLRDYIKSIEKANSADIYMRVFVDEIEKKVLIMGWIDKDEFFKNPTTHKLILPGKSELPLYFVRPIKFGKPLRELSTLQNNFN